MSQTIRILHTESSKGWGGQEHRTLKEMRGLRARGAEMQLLTQPGARLAQRAEAEGFKVHYVAMRNGIDLPAVARIVALIKREKFDIVSTHSGRDTILAGVAGRLSRRKPLVIRTRHLILPITSRFTYSTVPHAVITTSGATRTYLGEVGVPIENVEAIPTGIDLNGFDLDVSSTLRDELGLGPAHFIVGTVSILRVKKGHRILLDAVREVLDAVPNARFVFAGDGPQEENLRRAIGELGLQDKVFLLGLRKDIANVLAGIDAFILPTLEEALSGACIEAMAMKKPVISTNVGGMPELVADGVTGLLIPPSDAGAIASAVIRLAKDEPLRQRLALAGHEFVMTHFTVDRMCERVWDFYRVRLDRHRAGRG